MTSEEKLLYATQLLDNKSADLNVPLPWGEYPLEFACLIYDERLAIAFLANGAVPNAWTNASPLCLAIWADEYKLCKKLIDAGALIGDAVYLAEVEDYEGQNENPIITWKFYNPRLRVVDKERESYKEDGIPAWKISANIYATEDELNKKTPLNLAIFVKNYEIAQMLIERGAAITNRDFEILEEITASDIEYLNGSELEYAKAWHEKMAKMLALGK